MSVTETLPVLIAGAGGHGRVVLDALLAAGSEVIGFLEPDTGGSMTSVAGLAVLGNDSHADTFGPSRVAIVMGVGGFGEGRRRPLLLEAWRHRGYSIIGVVHPRAVVARSAVVDASVQVLAAAVVQAGAHVAQDAILNTASVVEHDCVIGAGAHVSPGCILGGGVIIGAGAQLGMNATVLSGMKVGKGAIVGAGSVVLRDVPPNSLVVGNPARFIRTVAT